jgi:hypothetical protein
MPLYSFSILLAVSAVLFGSSAFGQSRTCDETLWKHVYHFARFVVQEKCVTVSGTIVDATANERTRQKDGVRHQEDGDAHGLLKLDPGQEKFLNDGNRRSESGNLVFKIVCKYPVKQEDAKAACAGYRGAVMLPPVGSHVSITGSWVQDTEHERWFGIHPVTSIDLIK